MSCLNSAEDISQNPTMDNFFDLFVTMENPGYPFPDTVKYDIYHRFGYGRTFDHSIHGCICSSKYDFPGGKTFSGWLLLP
jgi:hypothetical protein